MKKKVLIDLEKFKKDYADVIASSEKLVTSFDTLQKSFDAEIRYYKIMFLLSASLVRGNDGKKSHWMRRSRSRLPRLLRDSIFDREKGKCFICGLEAKFVHHIFLACAFPDMFDDGRNLVPLCKACHELLHYGPKEES